MLVEQVIEVALPLCESENYELVHVEYMAGKQQGTVRVSIDKPGGVTLQDCVYVSRQLGDLIDVHIENIGSYRLEVSSPGPRRPLNKKSDYYRFKGESIKVETDQLIEGRKKFTGVLEKVNDDSVSITVDGKEILIEDQMIVKARLAGQ